MPVTSADETRLIQLHAMKVRLRRRLQNYQDQTATIQSENPNLDNSNDTNNFIRRLTQLSTEIIDTVKRWDTCMDDITTASTDRDVNELSTEIGDMTDISLDLHACVSSLNAHLTHLRIERETEAQRPVTDTLVSSSLEQQIAGLVNSLDRNLHNTPVTPVTPAINSGPGPSRNSPDITVKLPKLELQRFNGDLLCFRQFWDSYESAVHINPRLQPIDKMNYLLSYLEGEAKQAVVGLGISNDNYPVAVAIILQRYGNPQVQLTALYGQLDNLSAPPNNTAKLRQFYDKLEGIIRSLLVLNQNVDNEHLVNRIKSKLPREILLTLERGKPLGVNWTVSLLRQRLHEELTARETVEITFDDSRSHNQSTSQWSKSTAPSRTDQALFAETNNPKYRMNNKSNNRNKPNRCIYCTGSHYSDECRKYPSVQTRKEKIKGRCFICLADNHMLKQCRVTKPCYHCKVVGKHHQSLCLKKFGRPELAGVAHEAHEQSSSNTASSPDPSYVTSHGPSCVASSNPKPSSSIEHNENALLASGERVLLQTANVPVKKVGQTPTIRVKAILDSGCNRSYITNALAIKLKLNPKKGNSISLNRFATGKTVNIQTNETQLELCLINKGSMIISVNVIPHITGLMHRTVVDLSGSYKMIQDLPLADNFPTKGEDYEIDLLLGSDYYLDLITAEKLLLQNGLWLLGSHLGWILTGRIPTSSNIKDSESSLLAILSHEMYKTPFLSGPKEDLCRNTLPNLEEFWALETIGITDPPYISDDDTALKHFDDTVKFEDKRYQVTWPWKKDAQYTLPDNYQLAYGRFLRLSQKFAQNSDMFSKYSAIIQDQEVKGVIEKVISNTPTGPIKHYIPHHAVITPLKTTTKVRIVYDASARTKRTNPSLNDCLYRGPVFLSDLVGLLMRFRMYNIAIISDIEKAFLQVGLQINDRDVTRFLWFQDPTNPNPENNLQIYRFARVPFGMVSSPFLLGATIDHLMQKIGSPLTEAIRKNIYVDNVIIGAQNSEQAKLKYNEAKEVFRSASMNLREWISSDATFNDFLPEADKAKPTGLKILGICWDITTDKISIPKMKSSEGLHIKSKRDVLTIIAQTFDPLGFFAPVTITGKIFLQHLWSEKMDWDDPLTDDQKTQWQSYYPELCKVSLYSFPRKIGTYTDATFSLICFCDASPQAYATTLYLKAESSDQTVCHLIFAKSRLRPKKEISIPRMELLAVLIGTNAMTYANTNLHTNISAKFLFSDSQCVLSWIRSTKKQPVFVQNRLDKIKNQEGIRFRYVNTTDNPADLATRGKNVNDLTSFWWNGPDWILKPCEVWPCWDVEEINDESLKSLDGDKENQIQIMHEMSLLVPHHPPENPFSLDVNKYSTVSKLHRVTAWCLRFIQKLKKRSPFHGKILDTTEISNAMNVWESHAQNDYQDVIFSLKTGKRHQLVTTMGLFLDPEGFIRCGGRIINADLGNDTKFPKLLPNKHSYTKLVIKGYHARSCHAGISQTLALIRLDYWIPKGRTTVKSAITNCPICLRWESGPFKLPPFPPLPSTRVKECAPFTYIGLDYFGPLYIKADGQKGKTWVCIFTCLTIRAIHLEIIRDMSTDQFLMCLRRFISRRGRPLEIISDNASQFKLAKTVITKLWKHCITGSDVQDFSANNLIKWKFIVELAPWMGGFYERLISNVKRSLRKSIGLLCLTYDQLSTVLTEVESVVNSRPLVYVGDDIKDGKTLSPSDFLCLNPKHGFPEIPTEQFKDPNFLIKVTKADNLLEMWKRGQKHLSTFWKNWLHNYLLSLRERHCSFVNQPRVVSTSEPSEGQVVLMKENLVPRGSWKLVRIDKLHIGRDGNIRSALVRNTSGKTFMRSLSMLYPLECGPTKVPSMLLNSHSATHPTIQATVSARHPNPTIQATVNQLQRPKRLAAQVADSRIKKYYVETENDSESE